MTQNKLSFSCNNFDLMVQALTHSSYANENKIESNERLELLGDAVISLACVDYLYSKYPDLNEGDLTQLKANLVNGKQLSEVGAYFNLGSYIRIGNGESISKKTIGRAVEAVVGAFFLTEGYDKTKSKLVEVFEKIESGEIPVVTYNYKGELQKFSQTHFKSDPVYVHHKSLGQDHNKQFIVKVLMNNTYYAEGIGTSIKTAEQEAAKNTLRELQEC